MSIERYLPEIRFSEAAITDGLIFTSGQVPTNELADAFAQITDVLDQIDALLIKLDSDKTMIIDATIFLASLEDYAALNQAWDDWVAPGHAPARTTIQARLANPNWKVEIKIVARQKLL